MQDDKKTMFGDATASWNGYSYQGKVAIYAVLEFLNVEMIHSDTNNRYAIELENLEDFSILIDGGYRSIHQVKTYKESDLPSYKDAIWTLLGKSQLAPGKPASYLHVTVPIPSKIEINNTLSTYKPPRTSNSEIYLSPRDYFNHIDQTGSYDEAVDDFNTYAYCDGNEFCSLTNIKELVLTQIKNYYDLRNQQRTDLQIERVYLYLLQYIDEHVNIRHDSQQKKEITDKKRMIQFQEFIKILAQDFERSSEPFYIYHLREVFVRSCEEYLLSRLNHSGLPSYLNLQKIINTINTLDDKLFLKMCRRWSPHVRSERIDLHAFRELIPNDGIINPLLRSFFMIRKDVKETDYVYEKFLADGKPESYMPTVIYHKPVQDNDDDEMDENAIGILAKNIILNADVDDLHEVDVMISAYITMTTLEEAAMKHTKVPLDKKQYANITEMKDIRMMSFTKAKEVLEDE